MEPIGILGKRLVCIGEDGRLYVRRYDLGWFSRWLYRKLPKFQYDAHGALKEVKP